MLLAMEVWFGLNLKYPSKMKASLGKGRLVDTEDERPEVDYGDGVRKVWDVLWYIQTFGAHYVDMNGP